MLSTDYTTVECVNNANDNHYQIIVNDNHYQKKRGKMRKTIIISYLFLAAFERFNYENYGGTPILGLNKPVIIGHGISNEIAVKNMILLTKDIINAGLKNKITNMLK